VNDSTIRLIGEVFLLWGMGEVDVLLLLVWRWMRSGAVVVWLGGLLICVCDNSRIVGWLRPCHPVSGGLRL
jgi:hypothetical protein